MASVGTQKRFPVALCSYQYKYDGRNNKIDTTVFTGQENIGRNPIN